MKPQGFTGAAVQSQLEEAKKDVSNHNSNKSVEEQKVEKNVKKLSNTE